MEFEVPAYREPFGATHLSASSGTQPIDEYILKLLLRKEYKMSFPFGARPRAGQIVQEIDKCRFQLFKITAIGIHMIRFNIGHNTDHWLQMQKTGITFIRFSNQIPASA